MVNFVRCIKRGYVWVFWVLWIWGFMFQQPHNIKIYGQWNYSVYRWPHQNIWCLKNWGGTPRISLGCTSTWIMTLALEYDPEMSSIIEGGGRRGEVGGGTCSMYPKSIISYYGSWMDIPTRLFRPPVPEGQTRWICTLVPWYWKGGDIRNLYDLGQRKSHNSCSKHFSPFFPDGEILFWENFKINFALDHNSQNKNANHHFCSTSIFLQCCGLENEL